MQLSLQKPDMSTVDTILTWQARVPESYQKILKSDLGSRNGSGSRGSEKVIYMYKTIYSLSSMSQHVIRAYHKDRQALLCPCLDLGATHA